MRRRFTVAAVLAVIMFAGGCGPYADPDLTYADVDEAFLNDTVVAVSTTRTHLSLRDVGSTLFIGRDGSIRRIDNDGGLEHVSIAFEQGRLGFSDRERDYVLGVNPVTSKRNRAEGSVIGSTFYGDNFVSVFTGAGKQPSHFFASRTNNGQAWSRTEGRAHAVAECKDGVWVAGTALPTSASRAGETPVIEKPSASADPEGDEAAGSEEIVPGPAAEFRRVEPVAEDVWSVHAPSGIEVYPYAATCSQQRLAAVATVSDSDGPYEAVMTLDVATGEGELHRITGELPDAALKNETISFEAPKLIGEDLYAVAVFDNDSEQRFGLFKVDASTGESVKVTDIENTADISTHFKVSGRTLHVLDVTWTDPSRVRAFRLTDGEEIGSLEFDWIEPAINGRFTTFDRKQYVRDFVVLQPDRIALNDPDDDSRPTKSPSPTPSD